MDFRFEVVGIAFWLFLAASSVAGIISSYKMRRAALEPLRMAIERGQQLDPALVEKLLNPHGHEASELNPEHLQIGGIITIASGVGVGLLSLFLHAASLPHLVYSMLGFGIAACALCVGVGLCVAARVVSRQRANAAAAAGTRA
jgi:hypothetical protein